MSSLQDWNTSLAPSDWGDIFGNEYQIDIIRRKLESDTFPKFTMLSGPSGIGKSCSAEIIAKTLTGSESTTDGLEFMQGLGQPIVKYNMAELKGKGEAVEIISQIFSTPALSRTVYILEEVQSLDRNEQQAPFLDKITNIPDGVYIIMCTTHPDWILPQLLNRATQFTFSALSTSDGVELIRHIAKKASLKLPGEDSLRTLVNLCENSPRVIVKTLELLANESVLTEEAISKYFKVYHNVVYVDYLEKLLDQKVSTYEFVKFIDSLKDSESVSYGAFVRGFREFALKALVEFSTGKQQLVLSKADKQRLNVILKNIGEASFMRLIDILADIDQRTFQNEDSANYLLITLKNKMIGKKLQDIFAHNGEAAAKEKIISKSQASKSTIMHAPVPPSVADVTSKSIVVPHDSDTEITKRFVE